MGEIADMMLDGTMDPETGEFNFDGEDGPGFPMTGAQAAEFRRTSHSGGGQPMNAKARKARNKKRQRRAKRAKARAAGAPA